MISTAILCSPGSHMNRIKKKNTIIRTALKLFSDKGLHNTKISEIAKSLHISVGGIYEYFPSKQSLARASIQFVTKKLASELRYINQSDMSCREKLCQFVEVYFHFIAHDPEMIAYFFRVYLSNREFFCGDKDCGFSLAKEFITELEILIENGVAKGEFRRQNFYVSFSLISGILGAITFLHGEEVLEEDLNLYRKEIVDTIYAAIAA